jgi:hypothetical protein
MTRTIDFYFDFPSPYSYLAHTQLPQIAAEHDAAVAYHPFRILELMNERMKPGRFLDGRVRQIHVRSQVDVGQLALKPGSRRNSSAKAILLVEVSRPTSKNSCRSRNEERSLEQAAGWLHRKSLSARRECSVCRARSQHQTSRWRPGNGRRQPRYPCARVNTLMRCDARPIANRGCCTPRRCSRGGLACPQAYPCRARKCR